MGVYTFQWPHEAEEVYVTGSFDNWAKSVKLDKTDNGFEKEVRLPNSSEKVLYKFIVDGTWKTDETAPQQNDGHNNINNVLSPENIRKDHTTKQTNITNSTGQATGIMSGVTPDATTAGLAGNVPLESAKGAIGQNGPGAAAISSVAPDSTTAQLAKDVPLEKREAAPGTFPETPATEPESLSVKPIPATGGIGNPVQLKPGEKVPDPASLTDNTVGSSVTTDQAGYEKDASDPQMAFLAAQQNSDASAKPTIGGGPGVIGTGQPSSAAPNTTTAGLESTPHGARRVSEPADDVPEVVKDSIYRANSDPEAASSERAVEEKKEVEQELLKDVPTEQAPGEPAPTTTAATAKTAPAPTAPVGSTERELSPKSRDPTVPAGAGVAQEPVVSNGPTTTTAPETQTAQQQQPSQAADAGKQTETKPTADDAAKGGRRKSRMSEFFSKIKEKLK